MTTMTPNPTPSEWLGLILGAGDAQKTWTDIFARLRDIALSAAKNQNLDRETIVPDRLLAESAWQLWQDFPHHAPSVIAELKKFWVATTSAGTAVLILDGLSLRELPLITGAAEDREITPTRVEVRGAEAPMETNQFAAALGVPGRSKLFNNQQPATFIFAGPDVRTDVFDAPFADCTKMVPSAPRLFIWHKWLDEPLLHDNERREDGPAVVGRETKNQLTSDDFWAFVDQMRQGRRLVITGDHGYAVSKSFSSEVKDDDSVKLLRKAFGAKRAAREDPDNPWPQRHLPPLVCRHNGWLIVMGQRKWNVQGRFPYLCHRGLTLLEAAVPFIELPPK